MKTGTLISREIFTSSGSTVVPVGASKCTALVVNGGNGGNGGDQAGSNRPGYGDTYGGGGGYGAYPVLKSFSNLTIGASITVTVGAGGAGGAGGSGATGDSYDAGSAGTAGGTSSVSGAISLNGSTDECYPNGSSIGEMSGSGVGGGGWNFSIDANYDIHFQRPYFGSKSVYGSNNGGDGGAYSSSGSLGGDGGTTACSSGGAGSTGGWSGSNSGTNGGAGASFGAGGGGGGGANHYGDPGGAGGIGDGLTGGNGGNGSAGIVILWFYS